MMHAIGTTAGDIWHTLDKRGEMTLPELQRLIGTEDPVLSWGVGWLAREQKIDVWLDGATYRIRLR